MSVEMPSPPLSELLQACQQGTLIPVIGAGVSMSIKDQKGKSLFPSWTGLLKAAATQVDDKHADAINAMLGIGDYQAAADYARQGLKGSLWSQFFKQHFDISQQQINTNSLSLAQAIWQLSNRLITLNYDKVLRIACEDGGCSDFDNSSANELADFINANNNTPALWHLHGKIDRLNDIVFTSESYQKLYETKADLAKQQQAGLTALHTLCATHQLLFIGCSLDDAELLQQLVAQNDIFAGNTGPHYALVRQKNYDAFSNKVKHIDNLQLIGFADFGTPLLETIKTIASAKSASRATVQLTNQPPSEQQLKAIATKIAVLSANPIDQHYDYTELLKVFANELKCRVDYYPLSIDHLNDLDEHDYVLVLSQWIKGKLVIEDDNLNSAKISLLELEQNLFNAPKVGLFIFTNNTNDAELCSQQLPQQITQLQQPTVVLPPLKRAEVKRFFNLLFKKNNISPFTAATVANQLKPTALSGKLAHKPNRTKLPDNIDAKNAKYYIGRLTELSLIIAKVKNLTPGDGVLTLKGAGGMGKTATIKKVATELAKRGHYRDGIDFINCEHIKDLAEFKSKACKIFALEQAIDIEQYIKQNELNLNALLILDNLETLLYFDDKQPIVEFIGFISDYSTVVITSRERLNQDWESIVELGQFSTDDALALFIQSLPFDDFNCTKTNHQLLRQDIIENQLGNNPLAIKLIARTFYQGKDLNELQRELDTDFFAKTISLDLAAFDGDSDSNIERKKSLYVSINYSYLQLSDKEKLVFELLSLFPAGINLDSLKRIAQDAKKEHKKGLYIDDKVVLALQHKSLIENDSGMFTLQSIIAKFASLKLKQRNNASDYYHKVFDYNYAVIQKLNELRANNWQASRSKYSQQHSNFYRCIDIIESSGVDSKLSLNFLNTVSNYASIGNSEAALLKLLKNKKAVFANNSKQQLLFDVINIRLSYYNGDFTAAFDRLKQSVTLNALKQLNLTDNTNLSIFKAARDIFIMEGHAFEMAQLEQTTKKHTRYDSYPHALLVLGELSPELANVFKDNTISLEVNDHLHRLTLKDINHYISTLQPKDYLTIVNGYYTKAKFDHVDNKTINKLVSVNPYTTGLKQLMLAFNQSDTSKADALYQSALANLAHIKYYYVDALLHYAKFLQASGQQSTFTTIHQQGLSLAQKHHYRYLQYCFEDLIEAKSKAYDMADYPLPDGVNFDSWVKYIIKQRS